MALSHRHRWFASQVTTLVFPPSVLVSLLADCTLTTALLNGQLLEGSGADACPVAGGTLAARDNCTVSCVFGSLPCDNCAATGVYSCVSGVATLVAQPALACFAGKAAAARVARPVTLHAAATIVNVSTSSLDYGEVPVGTSLVQTLQVNNFGLLGTTIIGQQVRRMSLDCQLTGLSAVCGRHRLLLQRRCADTARPKQHGDVVRPVQPARHRAKE